MSEERIKPSYYQGKNSTLDVIDIIKILDLNFNLGNVLKYITRTGKKENAIADLKKAKEYIEREIEYLGQEDKENA